MLQFFFLRVVLYDWPDDLARRILLNLREAAAPETKLLITDFVLPLACAEALKVQKAYLLAGLCCRILVRRARTHTRWIFDCKDFYARSEHPCSKDTLLSDVSHV